MAPKYVSEALSPANYIVNAAQSCSSPSMVTANYDRKLALRIRVIGDGAPLVGPGRADLLQAIAATGSIAAAGRSMGMSYKRAWALVESMNGTFSAPLVEAAKGGAGGGGAKLTPLGGEVLAAYRGLEAVTHDAGKNFLDRLTQAMAVSPPDKSV